VHEVGGRFRRLLGFSKAQARSYVVTGVMAHKSPAMEEGRTNNICGPQGLRVADRRRAPRIKGGEPIARADPTQPEVVRSITPKLLTRLG
jgi:hypothetical protein